MCVGCAMPSVIPNVVPVIRITINPAVCGGRPCIRGLRIRVRDILDMLAGGSIRQEILEDYPYLEDEDITAALEFATPQVSSSGLSRGPSHQPG
jgi:uncharacterized protein (DUF433 family)